MTLNLGSIGFVYKGLYDPLRVNKLNYVVKDGEGQLFCCIEPNTGEPLTNPVYWDPWIETNDSISDEIPVFTKAYSGAKTQQLHDIQAEAISNLATASGRIGSESSSVFSPIPLVLTDMPFQVTTDSTDTNVIEFDAVANTITLKINASFNFLSNVTFTSSTSAERTITFALIDTSDDSVVTTEVGTFDFSSGVTTVVPFNTLLTLGKNGMPEAPLTIKVQALASGTGYTLNNFSSILASSSAYDSATTDASTVIVTPSGSISSTNAQDAFQELDVEKANASEVVTLTGNQTKAGVLTFTSSPLVPKAIKGDNTTKAASTSFVYEGLADKVNISDISTYIPTLPDATSLVKGIDYKGLLAEYEVTGSAVTSIDFSGLDINTHKSYRVKIEIVATGGVSNNYLFINGDTTLTNYYGQRIISNGTSTTSNRDNTPLVGNLGNGTSTITNIYISKVNGIAIIEASSNYLNNSTIQSISTIINKTATVTNITQLTFTSSVASAIGVGSTIRIYRGDV